MEKPKTSYLNDLENEHSRAKGKEMWDSRVVFQYIWDTLGLVAFRVNLGLFGALAICSEKYDFQK